MARTVKPFYNISRPVGRGVGGLSTDVMLIQYMLWHILVQHRPDFANGRYGVLPRERGLDVGPAAIDPVNGVYTPDLDTWILLFQKVSNEKGLGPLTEDGRVDPSRVGWGQGSRGTAVGWNTMQALNFALQQQCTLRPYGELPGFSRVPESLASELRVVQLPDGFRA